MARLKVPPSGSVIEPSEIDSKLSALAIGANENVNGGADPLILLYSVLVTGTASTIELWTKSKAAIHTTFSLSVMVHFSTELAKPE